MNWIRRNRRYIVIWITIIVWIVHLFIQLLIACYIVDGFFIITFFRRLIDLVYILFLSFLYQILRIFWFVAFSGKMTHNTTIIAFLTIRGTDLLMIVTPTETTIHTNTRILITLRDSWVACEVSFCWRSIRVAIAYWVTINEIHRSSTWHQVLVYFLLILCSHFHFYGYLQCFWWFYCFLQQFFLCLVIKHIQY